MRVHDEAGKPHIVRGRHTLFVGGVSPGERGEALTGSSPQQAEFRIKP
jgi:hypothetical protein